MAYFLKSGEGGLQGVTICDIGCGIGIGSLAISTVLEGATMSASDILSSILKEVSRQL